MVKKKENRLKVVQENVNGDNLITSETIEKAAKVLEDAMQKKRNKCWEEMVAVADKHNFVLGITYNFVLAPKQ